MPATVVIVVASTLLITLVLTWRVTNSPRELIFRLSEVISLFRNENGVGNTLVVRHNDAVLSRPQVINVDIFYRGGRDIASSDFDGGEALVFRVGVKLIEALRVDSSHATPLFAIDGESLHLKPSLIKSGQIASFIILIDGDAPKVSCLNPSLINVTVREDLAAKPLTPFHAWQLRRQIVIAVTAVLVAVICVAIFWFLEAWFNPWP